MSIAVYKTKEDAEIASEKASKLVNAEDLVKLLTVTPEMFKGEDIVKL